MRNNIITHTLSDKQYSIYTDFLTTSCMYNVLNAGRQSGKTFTMSRLLLTLAILKENAGCKIIVVGGFYTHVVVFFEHLMQINNISQFIKKVRVGPPIHIIFKNGTQVVFRSAANPASLRGGSYKFLFLDEFSFYKPTVFDTEIAAFLIAQKNAKLFISSTPKGKSGQFYKISKQGENIKEPDYSYRYMFYEHNPEHNIKFIKSEEKRLPRNVYRQEFLGKFENDGGAVFEEIVKVSTLKAYQPFISTDRYFAGIDWGRAKKESSDKTVLTIFNRKREVVLIKECLGDWSKQVSDLSIILKRFNPIVYAESNGIGDPLIEQLKKVYGNVRAFITSNSSKKEIVENLKMDIITESIKLPTYDLCEKLSNELNNYTYTMTKTGNITYHHRDGEHDDYVDSLAIANYAHTKHNIAFHNIKMEKRSNFYG